MKLTTKYWVAIRHIGDGNWEWPARELTVADAIRELMAIMKDISLASQLVFAMGRTELEVTQRVYGNTKHRQTNEQLAEELDSELAAFLAQMED